MKLAVFCTLIINKPNSSKVSVLKSLNHSPDILGNLQDIFNVQRNNLSVNLFFDTIDLFHKYFVVLSIVHLRCR